MAIFKKNFCIIMVLVLVIVLLAGQYSTVHAQDQAQNFVIQLGFSPSVVEPGENTHSVGYVSIVDAQGNPVLASNNVEIKLSSDNPKIASVPSSIVIPKSQDYAVFDVALGTDQGQTKISANYGDQTVSQNFRVGEVPGTIPSDASLQIGTPTSQMNVNSEMPISVFLQSNGSAIQAPKDITISFDYDKSLVEINDTQLVIKKGTYYAMTSVKTLGSSGNAFVKAISDELGLDTSTNIQISSTSPAKLAINVFPKTIGLLEGKIDLFVSLLDSTGSPTIATQDIKIGLFSNSSQIESSIKDTIGSLGATIKKGEFGYYLRVPFPSVSAPHTIIIGASEPSLGIATDTFRIVAPLSVESPKASNKQIEVYVINNVPGGAKSIAVYQLNAVASGVKVNGSAQFIAANKQPIDDLPAGALYPIQSDAPYSANGLTYVLNVVTSDSDIMKIVNQGSIDSGSSYGTAIISSGQTSGQVVISTILKGLVSGSNTTNVVNVFNPTKTKIFSPVGDNKIAFNSKGYFDLFFVSVDSNDHPLTSANGIKYLITPINDLVEIKPNNNFEKIRVYSSSFGGALKNAKTDITAIPTGIDAEPTLQATSTFQLIPSLTTVKIIMPLETLSGHNNTNSIGAVQLADFYGNPVTASNDLTVNLSSNNTQVIKVPQSVTISAGNSFAKFSVITQGQEGSSWISASAADFVGSKVQLNVKPVSIVPQALDIFVKSDDNPVSFNQDSRIKFFVNDLQGSSVEGALIKLTATNATISSDSVTTDDGGFAKVFLKATSGPKCSITAHVSKEGYVDAEETKQLDVTGIQVVPTNSFVGVPGWVIYAGTAAAIGGIGFVAYMFLKKPPRKTETDEEVEI